MDDITTLQIRVNSDGVVTADTRMRSLARTSGTAEKGTSSLTGKVLKLAAAYVTVTSATRGFMAVVNQVREFEVLRAGLTTATGDVVKMEKAWRSLVVFAAKTPFELGESVTAYTKMINYGLRPSERAMKSFGDTASAMQLTLGDMSEAVAKATAFEFEPLRKFAITAKKGVGEIEFSFRGVKETVKSSTKEIQDYFTRLGETHFPGAMEERMKTLDGAISNLGDSWDQFKYKVGSSTGLATSFQGVVTDVTDLVDTLAAKFESGEIPARLDTWGIAFDGFGDGVVAAFANAGTGLMEFMNAVRNARLDNSSEVKTFTNDWKGFMDFMFTTPAAITVIASEFVAQIEYIGETIGNVTAQGKRDFEGMMEDFGSYFEVGTTNINRKLVRPAGDTSSLWDGGAMGAADVTRTARATRDAEENADRAERTRVMAENAQANLDKARDTYMSNWDRTIASLEANAAKADALAAGPGVLPPKGAIDGLEDAAPVPPGFEVVNEPTKKTGRGGSRGGGAGGVDAFQQLMDELMTEEQAIAASYARRVKIIEDNTALGSAARAQASLLALDQYEQDAMMAIENDKRNADTMWEAFQREEELIKATYEKRKQIILEATQTTEEEKLRLLNAAQAKYATDMKEHNREQNQVYLNAASEFFTNLSALSNFQSKKMFKIAQAAGIANATISMYESAVGAYASLSKIPYVGPALGVAAAAAALAAGAANIAAIKSQSYSGAYEHGGMIPAGKFGMVGEAGPELIRGPAVVTSARNTADRYGAESSLTSAAPIVNIINNAPGVSVERSNNPDPKQIDFIVKLVEKRVAGGISTGNSPVAKSMESTYPLQRGRTA